MGIYDPNAELIIELEHENQVLTLQLDNALKYINSLEQNEHHLESKIEDLESQVLDLEHENKKLELANELAAGADI